MITRAKDLAMDRRYKSPLSLGGAKAAPVEVGPPRAARSEAPTLASPEIREGSMPSSQVRVTQDPRLGKTLVGRYRLDRPIGRGGMGRVYRATQLPLRRPVAVKILNREYQRKDPQFVRRFFLEAATAARLTHPNTITVFDYGEAETGELFIAMEYLRGRPLSRVLAAEGPFDTVRTLHVAAQICRALRAAHGKGIIHRDLKPGNIMLMDDGDDADLVKVLDFGLVRLSTRAHRRETSPDSTSHPFDARIGSVAEAAKRLDTNGGINSRLSSPRPRETRSGCGFFFGRRLRLCRVVQTLVLGDLVD